jgi:hypothetical protein
MRRRQPAEIADREGFAWPGKEWVGVDVSAEGFKPWPCASISGASKIRGGVATPVTVALGAPAAAEQP